MGDVHDDAAILDLITATHIQLHAMAMVLEETGVKNVESRLDAIQNRLQRRNFKPFGGRGNVSRFHPVQHPGDLDVF